MFAAAGYAHASGKLGVAMVTTGPGVLNAMTGLTSALCDGLPVLLLAGEVARRNFGRGALQDGSAYGLHIVEMLRNVTKFAAEVHDPQRAPAMLHERDPHGAVGAARAGGADAADGRDAGQARVGADAGDAADRRRRGGAGGDRQAASGDARLGARPRLRRLGRARRRRTAAAGRARRARAVAGGDDAEGQGRVPRGSSAQPRRVRHGRPRVGVRVSGEGRRHARRRRHQPQRAVDRRLERALAAVARAHPRRHRRAAVRARLSVHARHRRQRRAVPAAADGGAAAGAGAPLRRRAPPRAAARHRRRACRMHHALGEIQKALPDDTIFTVDSGEHFVFATHYLQLDRARLATSS